VLGRKLHTNHRAAAPRRMRPREVKSGASSLMRDIALITSTIAPDPGVVGLQRINVKDRLDDYIKGLTFYCECLGQDVFQKLVYVDNSGYQLDDLVGVANDRQLSSRIEFISYKSTVSPKNGRFYLELNLINHAMKNSSFLNEDRDEVIWKVTGRYLIKNIRSIIARCRKQPQYDFYVNCRNYPADWADFYLVGFNFAAYQKVFSSNLHLYEGIVNGEEILRRYLDSEAVSGLKILRRLPSVPRVVGVRGYDGGKYGGIVDSVKFLARSALNAALPNFWI
jgi:hypothetical protein